jgi:hypothetical protein
VSARRAPRCFRAGGCLLIAGLLVPGGSAAQLRASWSEGQDVSPAFEGWEENEDGSFNIVFGYMNRNWEEKLWVPVGPENFISPGPADQGQPTWFLPRRNRFVFKVRVPPDFGEQELVWTLSVNGSVQKAYGSLARDYRLDNVVIMSETGALGAGTSTEEVRANVPPSIQLEGPRERSVRVGEPLSLAVTVSDDGVPRRGGGTPNPNATPQQLLARALTPPRRITVGKVNGLHFAWLVYRGPGEQAAFDPPQVKTWEDTRAFANSPWAPFWVPPPVPDGNRWVTRVTFAEPGTFVLRGRADDGGLFADVEVAVTVRP